MQLGTFELKRILGQGGMAQVWLGAHDASGHEVAIKLMRREYQDHPKVHAQFIAEAQTLSRIRIRTLYCHDFGFAERTLELNGGQRVEIGTLHVMDITLRHPERGCVTEMGRPPRDSVGNARRLGACTLKRLSGRPAQQYSHE